LIAKAGDRADRGDKKYDDGDRLILHSEASRLPLTIETPVERQSVGSLRQTVDITGQPSSLGWAIPHLIACVEAQHADPASIRALPGFERLDDPDGRVPDDSIDRAWRMAADMTQDEAIGIHVAESIPRGALDLVEYAFRSSASVAAGLIRLARYGRIVSDRLSSRVEATGGGLQCIIRDAVSTPIHPARFEFAMAMFLRLARDASGANIRPRQICLAHNAPDDQSDHRRFFQCAVQFNAGANTLVLDTADAQRELLGADPALLEIIRKRLEKALASRELAHNLAGRVRRVLLDRMGHRDVTASAVAEVLAVSRRTLTRRLAGERTSFRKLLDEVRAELAQALLRDRSVSIADIAFFLQYSEPAAFHRSFRRWTGRTPQSFRTGG
jgi:AraC-like DNA-binding protein